MLLSWHGSYVRIAGTLTQDVGGSLDCGIYCMCKWAKLCSIHGAMFHPVTELSACVLIFRALLAELTACRSLLAILCCGSVLSCAMHAVH